MCSLFTVWENKFLFFLSQIIQNVITVNFVDFFTIMSQLVQMGSSSYPGMTQTFAMSHGAANMSGMRQDTMGQYQSCKFKSLQVVTTPTLNSNKDCFINRRNILNFTFRGHKCLDHYEIRFLFLPLFF